MKISKTSISVLPSKSSKDSLENETSIMNFLIHPEIKEKLEVSQKVLLCIQILKLIKLKENN